MKYISFATFLLFLFYSNLLFAQSGSEVEITESDIIVFCKAHEGGLPQAARDHGEQLFGSVEKYYENYHRIQCPPHFPSPLYMSVSKHPFKLEIDREIEHISKLSLEKRQKILNRPSKGFFKFTVLDVIERSIKIATKNDNEESLERYQRVRDMLLEAGAKRAEDLTKEEKAAFH